MTNFRSDALITRRIARAFVDFLNSVEPAPGVDGKGLEVVKYCLSEFFQLNQLSANDQPEPNLLINLFSPCKRSRVSEHRPGISTPAPTAAAANSSFGASSTPAAASPASPFSFGAFGFGSTPTPSPLGIINDLMRMELHPSPVFGQTPTTNFGFGMARAPAPAGANPFQFGGQPSQPAAPQNPFQASQPAAPQILFQDSGSFDGGSFSLGAGGSTDKSNRKFIRARGRNRKK